MRTCGQCGNLDKRKNPPCKLGLPCVKSEKTGEYIRPSKCKKKAVKAKIARESKDSFLNKKLDKLWSEVIRLKGYCELCGRKSTEVVLHSHHIFSRRHFSTRWDIKNGLSLCNGCHLYKAHKDIQEFSDWVQNHFGDEYMKEIREKAHTIVKYTKEDKMRMIKELQEKIENLK